MKVENGLRVFTRQIKLDDSYGETVTIRVQVEAPIYHSYGWTDKEIVDHMRENFHQSCGCEHDCCAHWNGYASQFRKIGKWTWTAQLNYAMNV